LSVKDPAFVQVNAAGQAQASAQQIGDGVVVIRSFTFGEHRFLTETHRCDGAAQLRPEIHDQLGDLPRRGLGMARGHQTGHHDRASIHAGVEGPLIGEQIQGVERTT
jgi:hypothetical protein